MNWQQPYLDYFSQYLKDFERKQAEMDPTAQSIAFEDMSPQRQLKLEAVLQKIDEYLERSIKEWDRIDLRQRQLQARSEKKWSAFRRLQERERERARKMIEQEQKPLTLYERMAAFIRSFVQEEKPQLPKDMYSVKNVQKERQQRGKPLKQSYVIRSKKSVLKN